MVRSILPILSSLVISTAWALPISPTPQVHQPNATNLTQVGYYDKKYYKKDKKYYQAEKKYYYKKYYHGGKYWGHRYYARPPGWGNLAMLFAFRLASSSVSTLAIAASRGSAKNDCLQRVFS
jgi:hypothetical protein